MCKRLSPAHGAGLWGRALAGWFLIALGVLGVAIEQVTGQVVPSALQFADVAVTLGSFMTSGLVPILSGIALIVIGLAKQRDDWGS